MPRRCAFGCEPRDVPMHRFPDARKFPEQFQSWVNILGGKLETASDFDYYKTKRICDIHFSDQHRNRNNRLSALAVPLFHLPGQSDGQEQVRPQPVLPHLVLPQPVLPQHVSTSTHAVAQPAISHSAHTGCSGSREQLLEQASTSTYSAQPAMLPIAHAGKSSSSYVTLDHSYSCISRSIKTTKKVVAGHLFAKIKRLRTEICRLRKKGQSFKARLKNAEHAASNAVLQQLTRPAQLFLKMQLQSAKRAKGRRFTTEEKVLALSLYKRSPKCYGFLHKLFTLPSIKAMKRLLSTVKIYPGINPIIFKKIKRAMLQHNVTDRLCSLMFDEMSLSPQLNYNAQEDVFEGFASNKEKNVIADHVLVFMVKGIKQNFKQPLAYYFTAGLDKACLKNLIKDVIKHAQEAGLIIVNTVCDQSTVNVGAITDLIEEAKSQFLRCGKEWRRNIITINGKEIIPLYDVPHLIKGIRNNLLNKDLVYISNDTEKVVKWEHYQKVYAADKSYGELRLLDKLTEEHINPAKINKMRVKSATQLFSHSVAVATEHLTARGDLPHECKNLIDITSLLNNLFDSLNVNTLSIPNGKIYKGPVKRHSPHHQLWRKAKLMLNTVKFRYNKCVGNKYRLTETTIPSVSNLIKTIEGMETIWTIVSQKYGFDALLTRHFNQDPIENFFGNIRSYGARNNSPNSIAFEGAFKALLLNNYNSPHSGRANCEEDSNKCIQTLEFFFTEKNITKADTSDVPDDTIICNDSVFSFDNYQKADAGQGNYVCGWVLTKCLKNIVKSCKSCRQNLVDNENKNNRNAYIKAKEYLNRKWLCYPTEALDNCFHDIQNICTAFLKKNVPRKNIKTNITCIADALVDFPCNCTIHKVKLKQYFINTTVNVILYSWCRSVNRILSGKLTYDGEDETKILAQEYYNKNKKNKNKK